MGRNRPFPPAGRTRRRTIALRLPLLASGFTLYGGALLFHGGLEGVLGKEPVEKQEHRDLSEESGKALGVRRRMPRRIGAWQAASLRYQQDERDPKGVGECQVEDLHP